MKEIELNFKIVRDGRNYFIEYEDGEYRGATLTEVLLWNILFALKTQDS